MTTIAVRDGVMACDSMVGISSDGGGDRAYYNCEKVYPIEGELIGGAGDSVGILLWYEWYMGGCKKKKLAKKMFEYEFDIVILHKNGTIEASDGSGMFEEVHEPFYAIGSGTKCALAVMHCGKSAIEAVAISTLIDPHTGGRVQHFEV